MQAPEARDTAVRLLDDPSPYVRRRVLRVCAPILTTPATDDAVVARAVSDPDFESSVWARRVIAQRLTDGVERDQLVARMHRTADPLVTGPAPTTPQQFQAVFVLAELRDGSMIDQLVAALRSPDVLFRQHAAFLLGQDGTARAVPGLVTAMGDAQPLVRQTARRALQEMAARGDPAARVGAGATDSMSVPGGGRRRPPREDSGVTDQGSLSQSGSPRLSWQQVPETSLQATSGFTPSRWQSESWVQVSITQVLPTHSVTGTNESHSAGHRARRPGAGLVARDDAADAVVFAVGTGVPHPQHGVRTARRDGRAAVDADEADAQRVALDHAGDDAENVSAGHLVLAGHREGSLAADEVEQDTGVALEGAAVEGDGQLEHVVPAVGVVAAHGVAVALVRVAAQAAIDPLQVQLHSHTAAVSRPSTP